MCLFVVRVLRGRARLPAIRNKRNSSDFVLLEETWNDDGSWTHGETARVIHRVLRGVPSSQLKIRRS